MTSPTKPEPAAWLIMLGATYTDSGQWYVYSFKFADGDEPLEVHQNYNYQVAEIRGEWEMFDFYGAERHSEYDTPSRYNSEEHLRAALLTRLVRYRKDEQCGS
jgi:hypothetical protein